MRVERERGDHRPDRYILCRVEHIHDEINEGKEHEIEHRVRHRQPAHVREENRKRDRRNECTDEHPRLELAPACLGLINRIADKGIDEQLGDTQNEDDRRHNADHIGIVLMVVGVEQIARDENHEVRRQHHVEHIVPERTAGIGDA